MDCFNSRDEESFEYLNSATLKLAKKFGPTNVTRVSRATSDSVIPGVRKSQRVAARSMSKDSAVY